jgi:hypothetical protein
MYNVWGLDAIALEVETGRAFGIVSDALDALLAAISALR